MFQKTFQFQRILYSFLENCISAREHYTFLINSNVPYKYLVCIKNKIIPHKLPNKIQICIYFFTFKSEIKKLMEVIKKK